MDLPLLDNTDNAMADIFVAPAHRRRGVGRALHSYAMKVARENNRKRLIGSTVRSWLGGPRRDGAGDAFATAVGASDALVEVRRRLDVSALDEAVLDELLAKAESRAAGYSLVQWRGPTPEAYLADIAYLDGRLTQDAPMGDLSWEPEKVDADRVRGVEEAHKVRGRRMSHTAMVHDASGRIVAWTLLSMEHDPDWHAWQQITIVDPDHRGHRLGTIVKIENLRFLRAAAPELKFIDTTNAASNDFMISINELLGFRPVDAFVDWQQDL
jgi:GNAT superfamily N-acetyltransferase